jgi:alkylation response protein AidB-like acyl-CoA dehydrogenase
LDERAVDVMYRKGDLAITAGMPAPIGKIEKVTGGYRGGGKFGFASGSDFANWIGFGATVMEGGKPLLGSNGGPVTRYCFVPRSQVQFKGNWNVMGLKGTGSYDYEIRDAFVPDEFALDLLDPKRSPEKRLFKLEAGDLVIGHAGVALGGMKRVLQEIAQIASSKTRLGYQGKVADSDTFKLDFARHDAKYHAARQYLLDVCRQIEAAGTTGDPITPELSARTRQVNTWLHEVAREVAIFAHSWGGSQGIRNPSVLGRCTLDLMTAATHALMDPATLVAAAPALIRSWQ